MTPRHVAASFVVLALSSFSSLSLAQAGITCGAGEAAGVEPGQMSAVVQLVCAEVARSAQGRADAAGDYKVSVRRLDRTVIVSLDVTRGTGRDERTLLLSSLDDAPQAAPRLASALIRGEALSATAKIDNLVGEESRPYAKRPSERFWTLGLAGVSHTEKVAPQGALLWGYRVETRQFAANVDVRLSLGGNGRDQAETNFYGVSLGGRYFFSDRDFSPFVGAGVGYANVSYSQRAQIEAPYAPGGFYDGRREWSVTGFMPYGEVGVSFARLSRFRVDGFVRVDAPLAGAKDTDQSIASPSSKYLLPVTIGAAFAF